MTARRSSHGQVTGNVVGEQLTEPVPGVWCDTCLLPSAFAVMWRVVHRQTGTMLRLVVDSLCPRCEKGRGVGWSSP